MILTVEHTSGGDRCHCCENKQELVTERHSCGQPINLKYSFMDSVKRTRLCAGCAKRLFEDLKRALYL